MEKFTKFLAALLGAILSFFSGLPPLVWVLLAVMSLDYVSGIACGVAGKSPKTQTGGLSSSAALLGLMKKAMILAVVLLASLLDWAVAKGAGVTFTAVTGATCLWFIASEGISVIENAAEIGVPIPGILKDALEIMRGAGDSSKDHGGEDDDGGVE